VAEALILADSQSAARRLEELLSSAGVATAVYGNPTDALRALPRRSFAVAVVSVAMALDAASAELFAALRGQGVTTIVAQDFGGGGWLPFGTMNASLDSPKEILESVRAAVEAHRLTGGADNDVTRALQAAAGERRELQAELEARTRFLANVSHELRTPLTSIREFAAIVRDGLAGPVTAEQEGLLGNIVSNVDHLACLIQDLLEVSEMEEGAPRLVLEPTDVCEVIEETIARLGTHKPGRATIVNETAELDLPPVLADRLRAGQVLTNLLSNALKFTSAEGTVTVRAECEDGRVMVDVTDTGRGISPEDLERVFDRFYQAPDPSAPSRRGTGLGLNIARAIVQAHGGGIHAESEPGYGSTFTFWLPIFSMDAWRQASAEAAGGEEQPRCVLSLKLRSSTGLYTVSAEELDGVASVVREVLKPGECLAPMPGARMLYVLLPVAGPAAGAVRDRIIRRLQQADELDLSRLRIDIRIDERAAARFRLPEAA